MGTTLQFDQAAGNTVRDDLSRLTDELVDASHLDEPILPDAPTAAAAATGFADEWNTNLVPVLDALAALADAITAVGAAIDGADQALADELASELAPPVPPPDRLGGPR